MRVELPPEIHNVQEAVDWFRWARWPHTPYFTQVIFTSNDETVTYVIDGLTGKMVRM